jgi:CDP-glucose 4,6-dehydratase
VELRRGSLEDLVIGGDSVGADRGVAVGADRGETIGDLDPPGGRSPDPDFWRDRRVLLTGHTGFKGAWLTLWLNTLGARVTGFSLGVPTRPSLYELARVGEQIESIEGDVRDYQSLADALDQARPEVVIHMAAQSLVRRSFAEPRQTYDTNVMGTVNLLDALRHRVDARVVVNVTSDKCYENREWDWAYREREPMGGGDPYSSSKGCSELVTSAFRQSFFGALGAPRLASARAGNVIGGGDWGADRLIADAMRGALAGSPLLVRSPQSVRPWQHVLNPLSGYLVLAQALWESDRFAAAWNFGPADQDARSVSWIVQRISELWPTGLRWVRDSDSHPPEARHLKLDSSRARSQLGWSPGWDLADGLNALVDWYRALAAQADMRAVTVDQINAFQHDAAARPAVGAGARDAS